MRYFAISDTHMKHNRIKLPGRVDAVFHAGDFCNVNLDLGFSAPEQLSRNKKQAEEFLSWYGAIEAEVKILVAGNHELLMDDDIREVARRRGVYYLHDEAMDVCGFKVYGNGGYRAIREGFGQHGYFLNEGYWNSIPDDVEILITHTPIDDPAFGGHIDYGCPELRKRIDELWKLRLHLCGHIHEGRGSYRRGGVEIVNAACEMNPRVRQLLRSNP